MRRSPTPSRCAGSARWSARRRSVRARPTWSPRRRSPTSTGCRCCSCPATSMPAAGPTRCCSKSKIFGDGTVSANDCFRPVSRYFDRITRPEQLLDALPRAVATMLDPATCGPATLAFCQDVQAEAFDYPESFFERRVWRIRRSRRGPRSASTTSRIRSRRSTAPLIIAGGGVHYAGATDVLAEFAREHRHSGRRNPGRQGRLAVGSSAGARQHRRHRDQRGQRSWPRTPTWSWASARGCRISPPVRGPCSRIRAARSSRSMCCLA